MRILTTIHAKRDAILFPQSHSAKFFWIGLSALTVLGTTRGNLLSGRAACFWNNDLDKNPTTTFFDSLTAKTLSLDRGHPTLQLSVSLKQRYRGNCWQFLAAQECQGKWKYDTPCETLLLSLHYCSVPGHFFDTLKIICSVASSVRCQARGSVLTARWPETSYPVMQLQGDKREGGWKLKRSTSSEKQHSLKFITRYAKITVEHPLFYFFAVQLWIILPFVHCYQGLPFIVVTPGREEASITLGVMFCNVLSRETSEPDLNPKRADAQERTF